MSTLLTLVLIPCAEMAIPMLENILQTRCTDLVFIVLQMGIDMKAPGMREGGRDLGCTRLEMGRHSQVTGKMVSLIL